MTTVSAPAAPLSARREMWRRGIYRFRQSTLSIVGLGRGRALIFLGV